MASILNATTSSGLVTSADNSGSLQLATNNGTTAVTIDTSQNVGIGTSSPVTKLQVTTSGAAALPPTSGTTPSTGELIRLRTSSDAAGGIGTIGLGTNKMWLQACDATNLGSYYDVLINPNGGNVGIGTTSPTERLAVAGAITATGQFIPLNGSTAIGYIGNDNSISGGSGSNIGLRAESNMLFATGGSTERMRITSGGLVGIGTSSPSSLLQVAGSSLFQDQMQIFNNPTSSAQGILFRNTFNVGASIFSMGAATTNGIIAFVGGNGTQGGINGNGAGISYTSASDYRLKENVAPMTGALAKISQLKPVTYTWKSDGSAGQGFIAHELQTVVPEAVFGEKDAVDEDGNIKPQSVDTSFLVATLTAAIQELKAELDATKAEVQALKGTL